MSREQANALAGSGKSKELIQRIGFVLGAFIVYRIGTHIPVPGVDPIALGQQFAQIDGSILDVLNMFSGGALERMSVMALGVMPYISASIIMNMLTAVEPRMKQIKAEGEAGRRKIAKWTRYMALVLATFQAFGVATTLQGLDVTIISGISFTLTCVFALVAGTMFLVWLGEQITDRGIGNGLSLIIFAGIVAGLPSALASIFEKVSLGDFSPLFVLFLIVGVVIVTACVVFVERGQRRLTVNYARQQRGNQVMQAPPSYFPLKMNMAGVIPPIFASSIILFPASLVTFFGQGAFMPGIRPGQQTASYIDSVVSKLTLVGAAYLAIVCLIPEMLIVYYNVDFYFGGTSLLIIVVVIMDMMGQIQSHLMSQQYESLMKKTNLTGKSSGGRKRRR